MMDVDGVDRSAAASVAVLYATREGQTRRIAERVATKLRASGLRVDVLDVGADPLTRWNPNGTRGAILAAPVHVVPLSALHQLAWTQAAPKQINDGIREHLAN